MISSGIAWSPEDITMKESPRFCQIVVTATARSAYFGLSRIDGFVVMPSHGSSPTWGLSRVPKITDATATEVAQKVGYNSLEAMGRAFRDAKMPAPSQAAKRARPRVAPMDASPLRTSRYMPTAPST